jgi:hypothetical protein
LIPKPKAKDPYIPYYITAGVVFGLFLMVVSCFYALKLKKKRGYLLIPHSKLTVLIACLLTYS